MRSDPDRVVGKNVSNRYMLAQDDHSDDDLVSSQNQRPSTAVVGGFIALLLLIGGIAFLYSTKLAPTSLEQQWIISQQSSAPSNKPPLTDSTQIELQRTQCYGTCPAYRVKIFGSGRVEFYGEAFVCQKMPKPVFINPASVQQLIDGLTTAGFFNMPDYTSYDVTDNPSAIITVNTESQSNRVEHYHGDAKAPRLLTLIEARIDEIANTEAWIGGCDSISR